MQCDDCPQLIEKSLFSAIRRCKIKNIELTKEIGCNIDGYSGDTWVGKPRWVLEREARGEVIILNSNESQG